MQRTCRWISEPGRSIKKGKESIKKEHIFFGHVRKRGVQLPVCNSFFNVLISKRENMRNVLKRYNIFFERVSFVGFFSRKIVKLFLKNTHFLTPYYLNKNIFYIDALKE